jgi:hypothetical protein
VFWKKKKSINITREDNGELSVSIPKGMTPEEYVDTITAGQLYSLDVLKQFDLPANEVMRRIQLQLQKNMLEQFTELKQSSKNEPIVSPLSNW